MEVKYCCESHKFAEDNTSSPDETHIVMDRVCECGKRWGDHTWPHPHKVAYGGTCEEFSPVREMTASGKVAWKRRKYTEEA